MKLYTTTPPFWLKLWYGRGFVFDIKTDKREVYLTFDDGPVPEATPWVLDLLKQYNAKATFFCIGKHVVENTEIYQRILAEGHTIGNHTYNHLNGFNTSTEEYIANTEACAKVVNSKLFRPPYGKIKRSQRKYIRQHYTPVMWSVLTGDFDVTINPETCLQNAIKHTKPGAVVVFHDSAKAFPTLQKVLPQYLEWLAKNRYGLGVMGDE